MIFPASNTGNEVEIHQIDQKTHERVDHRNIDESGEVEKANAVKGYEYAKNKHIEIDPDELLTPPLACGVLPGVYRRYLLASHPEVQEAVITLSDILAADRILIVNSVRGTAIGAAHRGKQRGSSHMFISGQAHPD